MKSLEKVSLIVSMYDGQKYIKECIDSILNQTYSNIELVLVDDGSPDLCGAIADTYASQDSRVKAIHKPNSGVSDSRNVGICNSTGNYIGIIDQDDVIDSNYVEYLISLLIKFNADIATTPQPDKFLDKIHVDKTKDDASIISGHKAAETMLYHKFVIAPWNKLIRSELIKNNDIRFNPDFFGGEGFAFSIECFEHAKTVVVGHRKVYHYRVGDPNSGASKFRKASILSSLNAQKYIKDHLVDRSESMMKAWKFSDWHTHCDCLNMMIGCHAEDVDKELYRYLYNYCKKYSFVASSAPISKQQKLRGVLFALSPRMASKIINAFRIRKFISISKGTSKIGGGTELIEFNDCIHHGVSERLVAA